MPVAIAFSHRIINLLAEVRQKGEVDWLRPDSKSQVTVEYDGSRPVGVSAVVVSTQHAEHVEQMEIADFVKSRIAPYKYPRVIEFVTALPKTETGKIQRYKLRVPV